MSFVVTENCINCKHTYCADVCPVDAFAEGTNFLVIDPDECIECAICVPACIVGAIRDERDVPAEQRQFIRLNAQLSALWPKIRTGKPPPPDAEEWEDVPGKLALLER